jgi:Holliday junction resolvase RusA-like endonuclease
VERQWFRIDLNPHQWAIGPIGRSGKKGVFVARHDGLATFQESVREQIPSTARKLDGPFRMRIWFWRRMDEYTTHQGRTARSHEVDVTNLQKGFEDALHKVLYDNDKNNRDVRSVFVDESSETDGMIIFYIEPILDGEIIETLKEIPDWIFGDPNAPVLDFGEDYNRNGPRQ